MPTQGERQNYQWRPNDNSVTTKMRYSLEAEHWLSAIKSNSAKSTASLSETFGTIGLLFSLFINLIMIVVLSLTYLFKWLIGLSSVNKNTNSNVEVKRDEVISYEEMRRRIDNNELEEINLDEA
jgi:hypothetical protein